MKPKISVVIPVRPGQYPAEAIKHLSALDYPAELVEVLIAEGDRPSIQRNEAVKQATGEIIYFLDDDSFVAPDNVNLALQYFALPKVIAVGGPAVTHSESTFLETCFGEVVASAIGTFTTRARYVPVGEPRPVRGEELILCNLLMKKKDFTRMSGLNPKLYPNEENELLKRMRGDGLRFYYVPELIAYRTRRKTVSAFARQMWSYGAGRAKHLFQKFHFRDLPFLAPTAFALYLLSCFIFHPLWYLIPLILYAGLIGGAAVEIAVRREPLTGLVSFPCFLVMHLTYGIGVLAGLLVANYRSPPAALPVQVTRVPTIIESQAEIRYANQRA